MKLTTPVVISVITAFVLVVGGFVLLTALGKPITDLESAILALAGVVPLVLGLTAQNQATAQKVDQVAQQTNGTLSTTTAIAQKALGALDSDTAQKIINDVNPSTSVLSAVTPTSNTPSTPTVIPDILPTDNYGK